MGKGTGLGNGAQTDLLVEDDGVHAGFVQEHDLAATAALSVVSIPSGLGSLITLV
jgi:hypothetical protein